jgi:hypothetical protein
VVADITYIPLGDLDESFMLAVRARHREPSLSVWARAVERSRLDWYFATRAGHSADDKPHPSFSKNGPAGQLTRGYRRRECLF